ADVMLQIAVELGHEIRIVTQLGVGFRQLGQRGDQRFGGVGATELAEAPVSIGPCVIVFDRFHHSRADWTAATNARIFARSLTPGETSMPLDTSTAHGLTCWMA